MDADQTNKHENNIQKKNLRHTFTHWMEKGCPFFWISYTITVVI